MVTLSRLEKASPEIPPVLPFSKGGDLLGEFATRDSTFSPPPLKKGDEGGFYGFSKG
jgi:hypothetical protein